VAEFAKNMTQDRRFQMAEVHKFDNQRAVAVKVPEFLKEPIEAAQARLGQLEGEAQKVWKDLMVKGRASRKDVEQILQRLAKQDWNFPEMRQLVERLRYQGVEAAAEWRGKAESWRTEALERIVELQGKAISFLGVATREQVDELSRELDRLARRIERGEKTRRSGKKGSKPSAEV
jgi:polyhydroxyalkanoate synthesis regulator phasin